MIFFAKQILQLHLTKYYPNFEHHALEGVYSRGIYALRVNSLFLFYIVLLLFFNLLKVRVFNPEFNLNNGVFMN